MNNWTLYITAAPDKRIVDLLHTFDLEVLFCAGLEEATALLKGRAEPTLVLTDAGTLSLVAHQWGDWAWHVKGPLVVLVRTRQDGERFLEQGARDVLIWPGNLDQLALVVYRLLRLRPRRVHGLVLSPLAREVRRYGEVLHLTRRQFDLLQYFMAHPGQVLTYEELLREVWGDRSDVPGRDMVRMAVSRLRQVLGEKKEGVRYIENVRGVGYRWVGDFSVIDG